MLDKTREFTTIHGGTGQTRYIQDGNRYSAKETYLGKVGEDDRKPLAKKNDIIPNGIKDLSKTALLELAASHGIKADGRMSEETIRKKLSSKNADILGAGTTDATIV